MNRGPTAAAIWWLVDILSRMLDPCEREVVCGDLAESGETGSQALCNVLGLVIRRQAALWSDGRPWLTLVSLVVPLGVLLSLISRRMADGSAVYVWLYANNWDWDLLSSSGFWHGIAISMPGIIMAYAALICWSWTGGFWLASLSRCTVWVNGALFCLVLLFVELLGAPRYLGHSLLLNRARDFHGNSAVFALGFYRVMFPLIVQAVLVLLPSLWGMRQSLRLNKLPLRFRTILWLSALGTLTALATQNWVWWQVRTAPQLPLQFPRLPSLLPFAALGPAGYMLAIASWRRWQRRTAAASS